MPSRTSVPEPWSPYGLEAHRVGLLRQRSRLLAAALVLATLVLLAILALSLREGARINTLNGNGSTVDIELPTERQRAKPTTLSVSPGRTTVLDKPIQPEAQQQAPRTPREVQRGGGVNWLGLLTNFGPAFAGAVIAWRYGQARIVGPLEQVNFGVYKGAMPLELHAAHHRRFVFTRRMARASLFGKGPQDHLPQPRVVARPAPAGPSRRVGRSR